MIAAIVAGAVAGWAVAIPIGAIGTLLISLSSRVSLRVGAAAALGVATTDGAYALLATLGGAAVAAAIVPAAPVLRWVAVVILIVIAARTAWTATRHFREKTVPPPGAPLSTPLRAYASFVGLTAVNPTTVLTFAALVIGHSAALASVAEQVAFALAAFVASAAWQLLLAGGGAVAGRFLGTPSGRLASAYVSSVVIVALAAKTVLG
ncbi:LysE family transporter [Fodinicola acaciae]|uniref:LysE family transporter n=1 Tax=Fodinicola acaciae TaxID=2681555 RepID=UPI0013D141A2|nr:LysE family transporter [Fodinicola acaciae]